MMTSPLLDVSMAAEMAHPTPASTAEGTGGSPAKPSVKDSRKVRRHRLVFSEDAAAHLSRSSYLVWKRGVEFSLALLALAVALPFIGLCALLVRLTSRGPAFYSQ